MQQNIPETKIVSYLLPELPCPFVFTKSNVLVDLMCECLTVTEEGWQEGGIGHFSAGHRIWVPKEQSRKSKPAWGAFQLEVWAQMAPWTSKNQYLDFNLVVHNFNGKYSYLGW